MKAQEKLLNDLLFAPAKYLDKKGTPVNANSLQKFIGSPSSKLGVLTALSGAFLGAATGSEAMLLSMLATAGLYVPANELLHQSEPTFGQVYYFDTNPQKKLPIPSAEIMVELTMHKVGLKTKLLASASRTVMMYGIIAGLTSFVVPGVDPERLGIIAGVVGISGVMNSMRSVAGTWRADQALKGHWNVVTQKPKLTTARSKFALPWDHVAPSPTNS